MVAEFVRIPRYKPSVFFVRHANGKTGQTFRVFRGYLFGRRSMENNHEIHKKKHLQSRCVQNSAMVKVKLDGVPGVAPTDARVIQRGEYHG